MIAAFRLESGELSAMEHVALRKFWNVVPWIARFPPAVKLWLMPQDALLDEPSSTLPPPLTVGKYGLLGHWKAGNGVAGEMVNGPEPGMLNVIAGDWAVAQFALAKRMASRRLLAPESSVLVTSSGEARTAAGPKARATAATRGKRRTARGWRIAMGGVRI